MGDGRDLVEVLVIESCFQALGKGLGLWPGFPLREGNWTARECLVTVLKPDGTSTDTTARLEPAFFRFKDPNRPSCEVIVIIDGLDRDDVPEGSRILVSDEVASMLAALA